MTTSGLTRWREVDNLALAAVEGVLGEDLNEPNVARIVAAAVPHGGTLVVASSMPVRDLDNFMTPREGLGFVSNRGASGIDGFVSTALGVALCAPGPVVALAGDLSMLHDQNGLLLTSSEEVDCTFVVINNDGGGIFSFLPQAERASAERVFGTPHGIDFADVARTYGAGYERPTTAAKLTASVEAPPDGVTIVEVVTDRSANRALHAEIAAAIEMALKKI